MKKRHYKMIIEHLEFDLADAKAEISELKRHIKHQGKSISELAVERTENQKRLIAAGMPPDAAERVAR